MPTRCSLSVSFPCVYVEKLFQTAVEIYVNYTTQSKLFLECAERSETHKPTTNDTFYSSQYDIAHHRKYVYRTFFVVYRAGKYGGNGHAVRKATSRNVVQYDFFFHSSTTLVRLGIFIVDFSKSHSKQMSLGKTPLDE